MTILIFEDDPKRIQWFRDNLTKLGNQLWIYGNVEDAKAAYLKVNFDVIFIDHDMDGRIYVPSMELNTGFQFAAFLAQQRGIEKQWIFVHSCYKQGAANIKEVLPIAIVIPFPYLVALKNIFK